MPRRDDSLSARWDAPLHGGSYLNPPEDPSEAVITIRDRAGFKYERRVKPGEYVSQREAAALLALPVMTINRWVRSGKLPHRTRNGVSIIMLGDLYPIARERGLAVKMKGTFLTG